ncbi:hypothetical protein EBR96_05170, partial [bacterium]|nr:hypothetical protein [bacterium]
QTQSAENSVLTGCTAGEYQGWNEAVAWVGIGLGSCCAVTLLSMGISKLTSWIKKRGRDVAYQPIVEIPAGASPHSLESTPVQSPTPPDI